MKGLRWGGSQKSVSDEWKEREQGSAVVKAPDKVDGSEVGEGSNRVTVAE